MDSSNHMASQLGLLKAEVEQIKCFVKSLLTPKGLKDNGLAVDNRFDQLGIMVDQLNLVTNLNQPNRNRQGPTFAETAKKKPVSKMVIFQPAKGKRTSVDDIGKQVNEVIKANKDFQVEKVFTTKQSVKVISFDSKIKEKIQERLEMDTNEYEVKEPGKLLPQVSFVINADQFEEKEEFIKRNRLNTTGTCEFVAKFEYKDRFNNNKMKVIVRLSGDNRTILENSGRIYCGGQSVPFRDNFYVKTCNKCYRTGHTTQHCHNAKQCDNCPLTKPHEECLSPNDKQCPLCLNAGIKNNNHKQRSNMCTVYNNEVRRLISFIDWEYLD